nr:lipid A deacylase LpxR family protein [uncultured Rhodopila sp.]
MAVAAALGLPTAGALAQPPADTAAIWTLQDENASIGATDPTDRFYVNGLRLGWTSPTTKVPDFLDTVGRALWGDGQRRIGVNLSQQIYTPADTSLVIPDPHDRPYAGLLLGNFSLLSDTADSRSVLTVSLGVVGPASGAEQLQNGFHNLIGQSHPLGWNSQIQNVPAFELLHERTWRLPLGRIGQFETDVLPSLTAGVGNVRTYLQTGVSLRFGQGLDSDFGVPRVRPGLSGNDAFTPTRPFAWYVFAGADGQAVAYDILLESSPFRGGPHVSTVWDVAEIQAGFAIMAHGMRLTFSYVAQTREFNGQIGGLHQFGSAAISIRF